MPMNRFVVLGIGTLLLLFAGCAKPPAGNVERRFEMPDNLGTFVILLDSNLIQVDRGIRHSDYKCGDQLYQLHSMRSWPDSFPPPLTGLDVTKDSMFVFAWAADFYSPSLCDSAQTNHEWLTNVLRMRHMEYPNCVPVDTGIVMVNGTPWAIIHTSDSISVHNDAFSCYTRRNGRAVQFSWRRIAQSEARFDFGAYVRPQMATARFE